MDFSRRSCICSLRHASVAVRIVVTVTCCVVCVPSGALAQFGTTAEVEREIPSANTIDPTASGTEVDVTDRMVSQTLDELIRQASGTRVVQFGAVGSPFCLRLRGAPCDQSTVLFGDIPISNPDTGNFDLSLIPLEAIGEVQVWRGGAPAWIDQGAIGGVLRLLPREVESNEFAVRLTGGSFGTWRGTGSGGYSGDRVRFFGAAGAAGTQGNYPYLDDNNTRFDPNDDFPNRRENSDFVEGFGFTNVVVDTTDKSTLDIVFLGLGRDRGAPGPAGTPALQARAKTTRLLGSLAWTQEDDGERPYRLQILTSYDFGRNRFDDSFAEIGPGGPQLTDDRNHSVFARAAAEVDLQPWLTLTTIASTRFFRRDPEDAFAAVGERPSERLTVGGTIETNFHGKAGDVLLELRPSVLLTWTRSSIQSTEVIPIPNESSEFLPTYRVGAAISPVSWLAFRGSVSNGFRLPTVLQLFGDRGTFVPNPELVPEKSLSYDAGVTASGRRGRLDGYLTAAYFLRNVEDQIVLRPTSQFAIVAENIDASRNMGVEVELRGHVTEYFGILGEFTWTRALDRETGNQIPAQPVYVAFVRPELRTGALSQNVSNILLFSEVTYIGESFVDRANLTMFPARTTTAFGLGALFFSEFLGLGFRVDDVFDVRGSDILGFVLPGRSFSGRLSLRKTW